MDDDPISHPKHYALLDPEPIDVIEAWNLPYNLGSAVKYIARAGRKGPILEDLRKCLWFVEREIKRLEGKEE